MKTKEKIERKGYKVTYNLDYKNGEQAIVSVSAKKDNMNFVAKNITSLFILLF